MDPDFKILQIKGKFGRCCIFLQLSDNLHALTKKEINRLNGATSERGLTIIALSVYSKGARLKLSLALAKRKKKHDKREKIKKRETDRELRRTLKKEF